jgi:hypothetical protein
MRLFVGFSDDRRLIFLGFGVIVLLLLIIIIVVVRARGGVAVPMTKMVRSAKWVETLSGVWAVMSAPVGRKVLGTVR